MVSWKKTLIQKFPNRAILKTTEKIHKSVRKNLVNWNILLTKGKESKRNFRSSGERNGKSLNWSNQGSGTLIKIRRKKIKNSWNLYQRWWKSSFIFFFFLAEVSQVAWGTWNPLWISEDHLVRLNTLESLIVKSTVRERWKRPPVGEWNRSWNQKQSICGRRYKYLTTCLLKNEPATHDFWLG